MEPRRTPGPVRLLLVVLALLSVALVVAGTREGPGTTPDGVSYLGAATNLADGRGLTGPFVTAIDPFSPAEAAAFDGEVPFIQWPPLYPLVLGLLAVAGAEPATAARAVSAVGLAAVVALTAWLAARLAVPAAAGAPVDATAARRARWVPTVAAAAAGALVLVQPYLALLSVLVASELAYLPLALGALWCATRRLAGGGGPWLVAALALGGAATLTRFIGVAVLGTVVLGELALGPGAPGRRAVRALGGGAAALVPSLAWSWWVGQQAGVSVRTLAWHPPDRAQWELAATSVVEWVVAPEAPTALRLALAVAVVAAMGLAALGWRGRPLGPSGARAAAATVSRPPQRGGARAPVSPTPAPAVDRPVPGDLPTGARLDEGRAWLLLVATSTVAYVVVLVATHALFDRVVPVGQRLLTPVVPPLVVVLVAGVARLWTTPGLLPAAGGVGASTGGDGGRRLRRVAAGLSGLALVAGAVVVADHASAWWDLTRPGRAWPADPVTTPTAARLRAVPPDAVIASNDPGLAWQSSGRFTIPVPVRESAPTGRVNERFAEDLAELGEVLRQRDGVAVVYGLSSLLNPQNATVEELLGGADLEVVASFDDAVVLAPPG